MNCEVCLEPPEEFAVNTNCFHGTCADCDGKLKDCCPFCRGPRSEVYVTVPAEAYETIFGKDVEVAAFDALFTDVHRAAYEAVREILAERWTKTTGYEYSPLCGVCMLRDRIPEVDVTLINLFFACSTITQTTVLDAMTVLCLVFGIQSCSGIAPKDVYFHFFINHCDTKRSHHEDEGDTRVADFTCQMLHSLVYDFPEIDAVSDFTTALMTEAYCGCTCNSSKRVLKSMKENDPTSSRRGPVPDDDDLFIPDEVASANKEIRQRWDNGFKWTHSLPATEGTEDEAAADGTMAVDCLAVYSKCGVCNDMMSCEHRARLTDVDAAVEEYTRYTNVATAVKKACVRLQYPPDRVEEMTAHYTSPACELNRLKFIHFYSLVKQPSSLRNPVAAQHLFTELFTSKRAHVCPTYHLASVCDRIIKLDTSQLKRTKRVAIQKWVNKILERHRHNYAAIRKRKGGK